MSSIGKLLGIQELKPVANDSATLKTSRKRIKSHEAVAKQIEAIKLRGEGQPQNCSIKIKILTTYLSIKLVLTRRVRERVLRFHEIIDFSFQLETKSGHFLCAAIFIWNLEQD